MDKYTISTEDISKMWYMPMYRSAAKKTSNTLYQILEQASFEIVIERVLFSVKSVNNTLRNEIKQS
jgi:hypothetical protein